MRLVEDESGDDGDDLVLFVHIVHGQARALDVGITDDLIRRDGEGSIGRRRWEDVIIGQGMERRRELVESNIAA